MTYPADLAELIEEFQEVEDKMERLEMVFDMADEVAIFFRPIWLKDLPVR